MFSICLLIVEPPKIIFLSVWFISLQDKSNLISNYNIRRYWFDYYYQKNYDELYDFFISYQFSSQSFLIFQTDKTDKKYIHIYIYIIFSLKQYLEGVWWNVITKSYHFSFISFISSDFPKIFSEKLITDKNLTQFLAVFAAFVMTFECFCHIVSHLSDHLSV